MSMNNGQQQQMPAGMGQPQQQPVPQQQQQQYLVQMNQGQGQGQGTDAPAAASGSACQPNEPHAAAGGNDGHGSGSDVCPENDEPEFAGNGRRAAGNAHAAANTGAVAARDAARPLCAQRPADPLSSESAADAASQFQLTPFLDPGRRTGHSDVCLFAPASLCAVPGGSALLQQCDPQYSA